MREIINMPCLYLIFRAEPVHINSACIMQLQCRLPGQNFMKMNRKISKGILYGEFLFFGREYVLSFWSMIQVLVVRFRIGQLIGYTLRYHSFKISCGHSNKTWMMNVKLRNKKTT